MRRRAAHGGFTLLELMVAVGILTSLIGGTIMFVIRAVAHQSYMHELEMAQETARAVVETVQYYADTTFPNLVSHLNADPSDDVGGAGTSPGSAFYNRSVVGLPVASNSPTGQLVEIILHTDETENYPELGLPRDLDGDGLATHTNVSASYKMMPVTVVIHWRDGTRNVSTKMETLATKH